jgi:hypothetical protein
MLLQAGSGIPQVAASFAGSTTKHIQRNGGLIVSCSVRSVKATRPNRVPGNELSTSESIAGIFSPIILGVTARVSVFEFPFEHHFFDLEAAIELISIRQRRDKMNLFTFRSDERLAIY